MADRRRSYIDFLERVGPDTLSELSEHVHPDVHFKDPFNDVTGIAAMHAILEDMFENIRDVEFRVLDEMRDGNTVVITWRMHGILMKKPWAVDGASRMTFDDDDRLTSHVDFWDAAGGLYERFPVIGPLLAWLRRRLSAAPKHQA